ncbi:bacteriocin biosynthesis protein SagD [Halobacteriales archaeon QS_1_68_17]|nr:MAG: bacteriocin biosynthesis protein SagD [Halobacteriales archaeon QS_1_68_17]
MKVVDRGELLPGTYRRLFGSRTGIVNGLWHVPPDPAGGGLVVSVPETADVEWLVGADHDLDLAPTGKGLQLETAHAGAVGEVIERYCLCWPPTDLPRASHERLREQERVVPFDYLDVYSAADRAEQFAPFDRTTPVCWDRGLDLLTGERIAVPAELVWYRTGPLGGEPVHLPGSSSGAAAARSLVDALGRGLLELVERDAFMRTWCRQRTPAAVDRDDWPAVDRFVSTVTGPGPPTVKLLGLASPVEIPTVAAVGYDDRGSFPAFVVGAGAALDPREAMRDAVLEVAQGWHYLSTLRAERTVEDVDAGSVVANFEDNALHYAHPDQREDVAFLVDAPVEPFSFPDPPATSAPTERLAVVCRRLDAAGATPVGFDVTTPDVADVGLAVARTVVPELLALSPPSVLPSAHPAFAGASVTDRPHPFP